MDKEEMAAKSAGITKGAKKCPDCGNMPHGMEQPFPLDGELQTRYEVGCLVCPPEIVETDNGPRRRSHTAKAFTAQDAVKNWNDGIWIEDKQLDRV